MKKWLYIISSIIIITIIAGLVIWLKMTKLYDSNEPTRHIPSSAIAVIKVNGQQQILSAVNKTEFPVSIMAQQLLDSDSSAINDALKLYTFFDHAVQKPSLANRAIYISLHESNIADSLLSVLFSFPLINYSDETEIIKALANNNSFTEESLTQNKILTFNNTQNNYKIFITTINGCLYSTLDHRLALNIAQQQFESLHDNSCFSTLERTTSNTTPLSVFINVATLDTLHLGLLSDHNLSRYGAWSELDIDMTSRSVSANGFLTVEEHSLASEMATWKISSVGLTDNVIPSSSQIFFSYAATERHITIDNDTITAEYKDLFNKVFSNSMALFSSSTSLSDSSHTCLALCTTNGTITQANINTLITSSSQLDTPVEITRLSPVPSMSIPVYKAFAPSTNKHFLNDLFPYVPTQLYLRYENTILFADNIDILKNTLYEMLLNRTYANDATYRKFRTYFSADYIFFAFSRAEAFSSIAANSTKLSALTATDKFYGAGIQMSSVSGLPYLSISAIYEPTRTFMLPTAWQTKLDSTIIGRPYAVINHNTQEIEHIVQDATNKIYLINPTGLVLWSRKVDSPIVGELRQIDYYNNKKLQYLFATKDCIHLIDRNGNNTANFPIHLQSEAVGSVTYLDYGNSSDFRLFIPCADKSIVLYDKNAKKVEGWEMKKTEGLIHNTIDHWVSGNKDYLISTDNYHCYITDRRGNIRIPLKPIAPNRYSHVFLTHANSPEAAFITSTADGKMASINIATNEITYTPIDSIDGDSDHYLFQLDNKEQFVFIDRKHIVITDNDGKTNIIKQIKLSNIEWASLTSQNMIAVWDKNESLAYLFDSEGRIVDGFPMPAKSPFAISQVNNKYNIVVTGTDGMLNNYIK